MSIVICPTCKAAGSTSTVVSHGTDVTCLWFLPYHDEQGTLHVHNPNRHRTMYRCSAGHRFLHVFYQSCPSCGAAHGEEKVTVIS